jgi:ribosomal silencing factor RsfS
VSSDFDDFIIVSSSNKKVAKSVKKALLKKIEEEEEYNPQDCAHCTMVGAHICEPCEGKWHS